ncbi:VOC family protein [uncultured Phascolarctobacterium sp.]|uniref:VOC family protein n=1 Tax=uncultured Phascolarctobacterium sp. TaxID=512296 RepID=UPI0025F1CBAB|nr:VOC family protein [uncultured Phascolarctobacterium sp.]
MLQIAHTGLYVKDLEKITLFYRVVFGMHIVCENYIQKGELIEALLHDKKNSIKITKLISDQGKISGIDDMLELIQVEKQTLEKKEQTIFCPGVMHIGFRVDDLEATVRKVLENNGSLYTEIFDMNNGRKCCFVKDPEGNYLELIEVKK